MVSNSASAADHHNMYHDRLMAFMCVVVSESGGVVPPNLKQFDEEIQRYKAMEKAMKGLRTTRNIGWTRVDAKPLKKSLESLVAKWSYLYVKYLQVNRRFRQGHAWPNWLLRDFI